MNSKTTKNNDAGIETIDMQGLRPKYCGKWVCLDKWDNGYTVLSSDKTPEIAHEKAIKLHPNPVLFYVEPDVKIPKTSIAYQIYEFDQGGGKNCEGKWFPHERNVPIGDHATLMSLVFRDKHDADWYVKCHNEMLDRKMEKHGMVKAVKVEIQTAGNAGN